MGNARRARVCQCSAGRFASADDGGQHKEYYGQNHAIELRQQGQCQGSADGRCVATQIAEHRYQADDQADRAAGQRVHRAELEEADGGAILIGRRRALEGRFDSLATRPTSRTWPAGARSCPPAPAWYPPTYRML